MIRRVSARLAAYPFRLPPASGGQVRASLLVSLLLLLALLLRIGSGLSGSDDAATAASALASRPLAPVEVDLAAIRHLQLFSDQDTGAAAEPGANASVLPLLPSTLNLQLEGVMLASSPAASRAVIADTAHQRSYRIGAVLAERPGVILQEVARDHVVIDNRGTREVLTLRRAAGGTAALAAANAVAGPEAAWPGAALAPDFAAASSALAELMQLTPAQANGRLIGLRLEPGKRLKDFVQLGFRTGDVVTAVNDVPMTDMSRLPELYGLLQGASAVSFSLLRDGQPLRLDISLPAALATAGQ